MGPKKTSGATRSKTKPSKTSTQPKTASYEVIELADSPQLRKIVNDTPPMMNALQTYSIKMKELRTSIQPFLNGGDHDVSSGISFLQLRYQLLLQYNMNLLLYLMLKQEGIPLDNHPVIDRLVQIRVYMEKIRPITTQLQYQVDQLLSQSTGTVNMSGDYIKATDNLHSNAQFQSTPQDEKQSAKDAYFEKVRKAQEDKQNNYIDAKEIAKNSSIYDQFHDRTDKLDINQLEHKLMKEKEKKDNIRQKALYSNLVRELRADLSDRPEERSTTGVSTHRINREQREKMAFEEENYMRLQLNRKEKKKQRQMERLQGYDDVEELVDFGEIVKLDRQQQREKQLRSEDIEREKEASHENLMKKIASTMMKRKRQFD